MAGDKLRDGFPVAVDFAPGEQPSDIKLDGWATQTQNALQSLEKAVGDILDQTQALGGGNRLSNRDLQISNIGRIIGPASMLNPQILHGVTVTGYAVALEVGAKECILPHPPKLANGSNSTIAFTPPAGRFISEKLSPTLLVAAGDYYVDYDTGRIYTYSRIQAGDTATYDYGSIGDSFINASFNVIPDARQSIARCIITEPSPNIFQVALPNLLYDQEGALATDKSDPNYNTQAELPSFLSVLAPNDIIPEGFVYLFDHYDGTVINGATFVYKNQNEMYVEGVILELNNSRYSVITVGAPLSEVLFTVRKKQREHIHDGSDGGKRIDHGNLTGNIYVGGDSWGASGSPYTEPGYVPSVLLNNDHPQYLMRSGYKTGIDSANSDNAMRGELLMGSTSPSGNNYANIAADSRSIFFGSESGPRLQYRLSYDALHLANKTLMADSHVTVGRASSTNANTGYVGFGNTPASNNIILDETSNTYQFKADGVTTGVTLEAGHAVLGAASNPRLYFNPKTSNNYLQHTGSGIYGLYAGNTLTGSQLDAGKFRTWSNQIYFGDGNDYLSFDESTNTFKFVADGSDYGAYLQSAQLRTMDGVVQFPDGNNRIVKSGSSFHFQHAGSTESSRIQAGTLQLNDGTDTSINGTVLRELIDGGYASGAGWYTSGRAHYHYYEMTSAQESWAAWQSGFTGTITFFSNGTVLATAMRGWSTGLHGLPSSYWTQNNRSENVYYVYRTSGGGVAVDVQNNDDRITFEVTYIYRNTNTTG